MKFPILYISLAAMSLFVATSCDDDKAEPAKAALSIEKTQLDVNESMSIHFTGSADNVVIYPGDESHNYDLRSEGNSGLVVNKGLFTYSYSKPGVYKIVCVATNHEDMGRSLFSDTCSVTVKVTDDVTAIDKLSAPSVLYDEVFATAVTDQDWLLAIPRKIHYKNSDPSVNLKKQKLKFYIESETTTIELKKEGDDEYSLWNSTIQYDLENNWMIRTTSNEGSTRLYNLYTLNYGEFKSFKLGGVTGKIVRTEYDYSYYTIDIQLPAGSDVTNLAPEFTLYADNEKVYLTDGKEVKSGDAIDFSEPVTFRFVVTAPENPNVKVESICIVSVKN